ncbi:type II toxin-antitoxin system HicA family toxin [Paludibaculum fermentans]|uniref:type II toxin-antitoxin system HicA family toxin n=1 Tax=Paludibaculum fermentans TaxID=1473598 RepID=UPI003EBE4078
MTGTDLTAALAHAGSRALRVKGSHHLMRNEDGRGTVLPGHAGGIPSPGLLHKILRDSQMTGDLPEYAHSAALMLS